VFQLPVLDKQGFQRIVTIDRDPDACPICHRGIEPKLWHVGFVDRDMVVMLPANLDSQGLVF
jgi:hypothetical protein